MKLSLAIETEKKRTIFIVDDEGFIRKVLRTHLSKEGYNVVESPGGRRVYDDIDMTAFDLVISDITMPEVDGTKVLSYVRNNYDTVPVIMLTGLTDISIAIDIMKQGAFDYIIKPVKKIELMDVIRRALLHKDLIDRNKELERQNKEYQLYLEDKVRKRTEELSTKAVELKKAYALQKNTNKQLVKVMAETIEAKDRYTRGHCERMKNLCLKVGSHMNLPDEELEVLEYGTLLHDLGKIGTRESVLNKKGKLTEEEVLHMQEHALIGEKILDGVEQMREVGRVIGAHHECYDGSGYPRGLVGDSIPLPSRIIAVVDLFDAMYTTRPYRDGLDIDVIIKELIKVAGKQLDPHIVNVFLDEKLYRGYARD